MANDPTEKRLLQALAHHENAAATLRAALALLTDAPRAKYTRKAATNGTNGHLPAAFEEAIALDATRRAKKAPKGPRKAHTTPADVRRATRQRTAELLATFDRETPSPGLGYVGVLVARGLLKRKGDGYVRTAKPFHADQKGVR